MAEKDLEDKVILRNVINALGVKNKDFCKKLKYNSESTLYNVFNGKNGISDEMIRRIMTHYPQISYLYLSRGKGHPIVGGASFTTQRNMMNQSVPKNTSIEAFIEIPAKIDLLLQLVQELKEEVKELKKQTKQ